jgi:hypothetical protein
VDSTSTGKAMQLLYCRPTTKAAWSLSTNLFLCFDPNKPIVGGKKAKIKLHFVS